LLADRHDEGAEDHHAELNSETGGSAAAAGKTLQGQLNITKETFKNLAAQIVSAVLPAVTDFAKIVSRATTFLSEHQKVAKILFVALGALSVVLLTISASLKIATAATTIWSAATKLATAAQWLLNAALTANPIGVVIVALAALGVAMVLAYTKIKIFREGVQEAWTWIKDHWPLILGIMAGPVGLAVEQIIVHRNRLVQVFGALPGMIAGALGDLRAFFFHQIIDKFTGAIDDGVKAVKRAISNLFGKVIDWVKDVLGINSPSTVFHEMGRQSVQGFINGVGSMAGVLKKAVVGMVESLPSKALGAATGVIGAIPGAKGTIVGEGPKSGIHASPDLAKQFAVTQMKAFGWGPSQMAALEPLWNGESGWRWNALNRSSGAYGIPQSLPASKMASAGKDWHENAFTQILWGLRYIKDRYGSPSAAYGAWQSRSPHWYAKGGIIRRPMFAMMGEEGPEAIIPLSPNRKKEAAGILSQISPQVGLQSWQDKTLEFFKSLWNVAKPFYGGAAMPMLNFVEKGIDITRSFVSGPSHGPNTPGSRTVNWTHAASNALFGNKEWMRQWALDAALHEWVHIFQKPGVFGTPWKAEGGAVDFVRMMGKKIYSMLGIDYTPGSVGGQYEGWATRVMKELGPTWVLRDQFRDPRAVAGLKSAVFDKGGWLQPGLTLAANNTGRPEPVGGGGNVTINYNGTIIHEREAEQSESSTCWLERRDEGRSVFPAGSPNGCPHGGEPGRVLDGALCDHADLD
jgi:hypothetical protein